MSISDNNAVRRLFRKHGLIEPCENLISPRNISHRTVYARSSERRIVRFNELAKGYDIFPIRDKKVGDPRYSFLGALVRDEVLPPEFVQEVLEQQQAIDAEARNGKPYFKIRFAEYYRRALYGANQIYTAHAGEPPFTFLSASIPDSLSR